MPIKEKITVIGASNIDLIGFSKETLVYKDANIGTLETILGGVGRNIAENLSHLDVDVEFLSVFADDAFSKIILDSCNDLGISTTHSITLKDSDTSTYMAIMDSDNDLAVGLSAMDIYNTIPNSFILDSLKEISKNTYCLLETNMPVSILELVTNELPNVRFALEAVSSKKALKAMSILDKVYILKCNLLEAELLSGIEVEYEEDSEKLVAHFLALGIKKVFITMGRDGVVYGDSNGIWIEPVNIIPPVNTNGAGDAFMAGILYGEMQGYEIFKMVQFASACSKMTILHKNAVNPHLNKEEILKEIT
ncbi:MAG: pseudouridine kinase [Ulvibacter sp.]|jgi:pseudouridine kinase